MLFIDLDDFKMINDTMGHESGDELIVDVAGGSGDHRSSDVRGASGERRFRRLMGDIPNEPVEPRTGYPFGALGPLQGQNRSVSVSASIGIAVFRKTATALHCSFVNSDLAMYQSKAVGRGSATFHADAERGVRAQVACGERSIRRWNATKFEVAYQSSRWRSDQEERRLRSPAGAGGTEELGEVSRAISFRLPEAVPS